MCSYLVSQKLNILSRNAVVLQHNDSTKTDHNDTNPIQARVILILHVELSCRETITCLVVCPHILRFLALLGNASQYDCKMIMHGLL